MPKFDAVANKIYEEEPSFKFGFLPLLSDGLDKKFKDMAKETPKLSIHNNGSFYTYEGDIQNQEEIV
jgi:hypothetical protein